MNIKRAKQEIKDAVEAYLLKDAFGEYQIPAIRQRPILLMGPPGIGKTQVMEQIAKEMRDRTGILHDHPPHETERGGPAVYPGKGVRRQDIFCDRIYDE